MSEVTYNSAMVEAFLEPRREESVPSQYAYELAQMAHAANERAMSTDSELAELRTKIRRELATHFFVERTGVAANDEGGVDFNTTRECLRCAQSWPCSTVVNLSQDYETVD